MERLITKKIKAEQKKASDAKILLEKEYKETLETMRAVYEQSLDESCQEHILSNIQSKNSSWERTFYNSDLGGRVSYTQTSSLKLNKKACHGKMELMFDYLVSSEPQKYDFFNGHLFSGTYSRSQDFSDEYKRHMVSKYKK
jgi:hypothetical protein